MDKRKSTFLRRACNPMVDDVKYHHREMHYHLCACCHKYDLTREEIQGFPLENDEEYIRETIQKAFAQKEFQKRYFLVDYLLNGYLDASPSLPLLLELWLQAEQIGIHLEPVCFSSQFEDELLKPEYLPTILKILNYRHKEHDSLIDDIIRILLQQERHELALFFNAKISTPRERIYQASCAVLSKSGNIKKDIFFLKQINESLKHEKIENDE